MRFFVVFLSILFSVSFHDVFTLLLSHAPIDFPDLGDHPIDLHVPIRGRSCLSACW